MIEMTIDSIRVSMMNYQRVVILKEKDSERLLPIWIGPAEADAIAVKLQDIAVPRPLTHDLLVSVIDTLSARLAFIVVNELQNDTFFAKLILRVNGDKEMVVDCRPSDAIALAVRTKVPIFVEEEVLNKAGISMDKETGKPILPGREGDNQGEIGEAELKRLSAFKDVIQELNLEDLGKEKS